MLQAIGGAAQAVGRFARRHRRALVIGGLAGAAVAGYWRVRSLLHEAEALQRALRLRALEEDRYRRYQARAKTECLTAVVNFLPTLRKRLFETVDVNGPVRELKQLRRVSRSPGGNSGCGNGSGSGSATGGDGHESPEEDPREAELWEEVKVTGLVRLMTALYVFSALNLMLRLQLHILGRHSFEEWLHMFRADVAAGEGPPATAPPQAAGEAPAATTTAAASEGASSAQEPLAAAAAAVVPTGVSMEARHTFLSSTYEYLLGDGLRALAADVRRAVKLRTAHWRMDKVGAICYTDFVEVLREVRLEMERPAEPAGATAAAGDAASTPPLLQYFINPRDFGRS
ncbi:unnamed protein product, partial [Phaeothamnion confervicola]